jgi:import inner membrane translocase subunit TIM54
MRLPSRNWSIFFSVVGSFAGAVYYDRRQKKLIQKKWCDLVADVAQRPLPVQQMPRKLTVYLSAAPGDGIRPTRDYFREYIKPILVAAAMDYDVIEGRREGEVRYGTAEQIRKLRRKRGEQGLNPVEEEPDVAQAIDMIREKMQVLPEPMLAGDLVLGRHTWKEYIRGVHEGWLGPLDEPPPPVPEPSPVPVPVEVSMQPSAVGEEVHAAVAAVAETGEAVGSGETAATEPEKTPEEIKAEEKPKKPKTPPAYISTAAYPSSQISPHIPQVLDPSAPITHRHLLGFLKTPQRTYDFLNRRKLADQIGREVAAIVLAANRPYQQDASFAISAIEADDAIPVATRAPESDMAEVVQTREAWEQQAVLSSEEPYWHKSVRKPLKTDDTISQVERVWKNDVVMDPRIAERMRRFELSAEEDDRSRRIWEGTEKGRAVPVVDLRKEMPKMGPEGDD